MTASLKYSSHESASYLGSKMYVIF